MSRGGADYYRPTKTDTRSGTTKLIIETTDGSDVTVLYRLGDNFVFKVGGGLTMNNLVFNAIDSQDDDNYDATDDGTTCSLGSITINPNCPYKRNPTEYCQGGMYTGSFFEFDVTSDTVSREKAPILSINGGSFSNFLYEMDSFIAMNKYGGHIEIVDTVFDEFNFCGSFIRFKDPEAVFDNKSYFTATDYATRYRMRSSTYNA